MEKRTLIILVCIMLLGTFCFNRINIIKRYQYYGEEIKAMSDLKYGFKEVKYNQNSDNNINALGIKMNVPYSDLKSTNKINTDTVNESIAYYSKEAARIIIIKQDYGKERIPLLISEDSFNTITFNGDLDEIKKRNYIDNNYDLVKKTVKNIDKKITIFSTKKTRENKYYFDAIRSSVINYSLTSPRNEFYVIEGDLKGTVYISENKYTAVIYQNDNIQYKVVVESNKSNNIDEILNVLSTISFV